MEFVYEQSPESMKSTTAALYWLFVAMGNYGETLLVTMVSNFTKNSKQGNWSQNDINKGRFKRLEIAGEEIPHKVVDEEAGKRELELVGIN
ncbi:hypothetical protein HPP92_024702 [Vanilla planifolia]|uniref:Uncharacterized protein n=1 Tax=Vanilla planifolia TaxID=51239 RepID=A0A835U9N5_VANPL|nr:hypothetical protein HPP92_024702 [Vanilla planifolia]